ncbi:MAG: methyltransferase regulatory domain-containing protein [Candidatus Parabeggiatoa sp.]|nr:methyltransferase regulatory domain-containing protein [Candidatus Parabeggiatoa sp.]
MGGIFNRKCRDARPCVSIHCNASLRKTQNPHEKKFSVAKNTDLKSVNTYPTINIMIATKTRYDELPYTCNAMPYAQPDRLATLALLFGMTPPSVQTCRVLEIGCCDGSNIIPTAYAFPEADIWGIDLSAQDIAKGQAQIQALGLKNITLKHQNLLEVDDRFGQFDYIIAHGIYSWMSPEVQDKILHICKHHLTANGIAYVSYNTKPGWNMHSTLRDMMRYHTAAISDSTARTEQSKALLEFLSDATAKGEDRYSQFVSAELNEFKQLPESFVCQEFINEENHPLYFHEFIERAKTQGLAYLGDAFLHTMLTGDFSPPIAEALQQFKGDLIHQEQMMDYLRNRHFRHTLLCHQDMPLTRSLSPDVIRLFHIASSLEPVANTASPAEQQFENEMGSLSSDQPLIQAAIRYLAEQWPQSVTFSELVKQAQQQIKAANDAQDEAQDESTLADMLLKTYSMGLIELQSNPAEFVTTISEKPEASPLARLQVKRSPKVTNLRCEWFTIKNQICLYLLPYLDGKRDHAALLALLNDLLKKGQITLNVKHQETGEQLTLSDNNKREILSQLLDEALQKLARVALLIH